jgi:hypothetical protein
MSNNHVFQEFQAILHSPEVSQRKTLMDILRKNSDTVYGKEFGFAGITNEKQFRQQVPLNRYIDLKPYIDRAFRGEKGVLTKEYVKAFFETSGTSSDPKYIPVTSSFIQDKTKAMNLYWKFVYDKFPDLKDKKIVANFSSGTSFRYTENGVLIGSETDYWNLITQNVKKKSKWPIFYDLLKIADYRVRYYCIAMLLLQDDIAAFMSPNPSTLYILLQMVEDNFASLIRDISNGTIDSEFRPKSDIYNSFLKRVQPNPVRAEELEDIASSSGGRVPFHRIWPGLQLKIYWQSTMLKPYTDKVSSRLKNVANWDHLYQASEAIVSIPDRPNRRGGIANLIGNFFEFITPCDGSDQRSPEFCDLMHLKQGQSYEIVITNSTGLYRYRIGDVIRVLDFVQGVPRFEFVGRTGKVCSMTGEKITENQVVEAFEATRNRLCVPPIDYCIFPIDDKLPHYGLILFTDNPARLPDLPVIAEKYEEYICQMNGEYMSKRKSERLGAMEFFVTAQKHAEFFSKNRGEVTDQTKPIRLSKEFNLNRRLDIIGRST